MFPEAYLVDDLFAVIVIGIVRFPVICSPGDLYVVLDCRRE